MQPFLIGVESIEEQELIGSEWQEESILHLEIRFSFSSANAFRVCQRYKKRMLLLYRVVRDTHPLDLVLGFETRFPEKERSTQFLLIIEYEKGAESGSFGHPSLILA